MGQWTRTCRGYWTLVAVIMAAAMVIHGPALGAGYLLDDYAQLAMLEGQYPVTRASWDLYTFSSGARAETQRLMETGLYPWWSHPELRLSMFRPLSSWLMALDYHLFGLDPLSAHLHTLVYFIGLLLAVASLFRRVLPAVAAPLALACFAFDQAHPVALGWLANRTAVLSALFAVLSLIAYGRFRDSGRRPFQLLSVATLSASFMAGEYAFCGLGYFVAFAWLQDAGPPLGRARALALTVAPPMLGYLVVRQWAGGGPAHSGIYVDPLSAPLRFAEAVAGRYPALLADGLLTLPAEHWSFGSPTTGALVGLGILPERALAQLGPYRSLHGGLGWFAGALALAACVWLWRRAEGPRARGPVVLAVGALLAALPVSGSLPGSRLLLLPTVGFAALFGGVVHRWLSRELRGRLWAAPLSLVVLGLHGLMEPAAAARVSRAWAEGPKRTRSAVALAPVGEASQVAVITGSADPALLIYMGTMRRLAGLPAPTQTLALSGNRHPFRLARPDSATLEVRYGAGRGMLGEPFEQMFRDPATAARDLAPGRSLRLRGVEVTILEATRLDGHGVPTAVRFAFDQGLAPPAVRVVLPTREGVRALPLPQVGMAIELPAPAVPLSKRPLRTPQAP